MNATSVPLRQTTAPAKGALRLVPPREPASWRGTSAVFWTIGIVLASYQAWVFRFQVTADSISYLDMSDGMLRGGDWHRLINGTWSPLYPFLLGLFRRIIPVSPAHEIALAHALNVVCFVFAFGCFEFLLRSLYRSRDARSDRAGFLGPLPLWATVALGYALFLWASLSAITLCFPRPDMLLAGLVYVTVGILVRMRHRPAQWSLYLALGLALGLGFLTKAIMLPLGLLLLGASLFAVDNWRPAIKMAACSAALLFAIGSLYCIPLSAARGHLTVEEAGPYNYLIHVDLVGPGWYPRNPGHSAGSLIRVPEAVSSAPAAYVFPVAETVTHALRFDPAYWTEGLKPRFVAGLQLAAARLNLSGIRHIQFQLRCVIVGVVVLACFVRSRKEIFSAFTAYWPLWLTGLLACALYVPIHVEPRYVGCFIALFWFGILLGFRWPRPVYGRIALALTLLVIGLTLLPLGRLSIAYLRGRGSRNTDAEAAAQLLKLGVHSGDRVARITRSFQDLCVERIARVEVAAEVDTTQALDFWNSPVATQEQILDAMSSRGIKAVIATAPKLNASNQANWMRLGKTDYWVWLPKS